MPTQLTALNVFIASPGGLTRERKAFRQSLTRYSDSEASHSGIVFVPRGWEDTLGGVGRPQSLINEEIRRCDYLVLVLADRWGSAPDVKGAYTSGTEEEFHVALECLRDTSMPMRQIVVFFKAVSAKQLSDPGPQLQQVLDFKKSLEKGKAHFFHNFDTTRSFEDLLRAHLSEWVRAFKRETEVVASDSAELRPTITLSPDELNSRRPDLRDDPQSSRYDDLLTEATQLAAEGQRTEAEALLARAIVSGGDAVSFLIYGRFLRTDGRLKQAQTMLERATELAYAERNLAVVAGADQELGSILHLRGDLDGAEEKFRAALATCEESKDEQGIANACGNLGSFLLARGDLDAANVLHQRALEIEERLEDEHALAITYCNLGNVARARLDVSGAEQMYRRSLELVEQFDDLEGVGLISGNLGVVLSMRGDLDGAEEMLCRALAIAERLNDQEGIASACGNLGNVFSRRGDLENAEQMHRRSLQIEERLGRLAGIASDYGNIGVVLQERGDLEGAEDMYRRSLAIEERLGRPEGMAADYRNLTTILIARGDFTAAEEMCMASLRCYRHLGATDEIALMSHALEELRKLGGGESPG